MASWLQGTPQHLTAPGDGSRSPKALPLQRTWVFGGWRTQGRYFPSKLPSSQLQTRALHPAPPPDGPAVLRLIHRLASPASKFAKQNLLQFNINRFSPTHTPGTRHLHRLPKSYSITNISGSLAERKRRLLPRCHEPGGSIGVTGGACPTPPCPGTPGWEQTTLAPGFAAAKGQRVPLVCLGKEMVSCSQATT